MATVTTAINKEYLDAYDGFDQQKVGLGLATGVDQDGKSTDTIYATPSYAKKKTQDLAIGLISEIVYSGFDVDYSPQILVMHYETPYNTILAYSLRYATPILRRAILKFVLDANRARIKSNLPILVDYYALKKAIPDSQYLVRRYKVVGIRVKDTFKLNEWDRIARQKTPFDGYYKKFKN